jgi:quercetin dioxygenase-like cupin family protein
MTVVDPNTPPVQMRPGITGRWLAGSSQGASGVSVLRNWIEPEISAPHHRHDAEEIVLVEAGEIWVEIDGVRHRAGAGQTVIIPPRAVHAWGTFAGKAQLLFVWPGLDPFAPGKSQYLDGAPPTVA